MLNLWIAAAAFVVLHWLVPRGPVRRLFVDQVGEQIYLRGFALASIAVLCWMAIAYAQARLGPGNIPLFGVPGYALAVNLMGQFVAWQLIIGGLTTPNPGTVGQGGRVEQPDIARGILRISRHPFLWGVSLFSALHMAAVPTLAAWVMFGSLTVVALTGARRIDSKRARVGGASWARFEQQTSNLPFAAILRGRQSLRWAEIGWRRAATGTFVWALFSLHPWLFGAA